MRSARLGRTRVSVCLRLAVFALVTAAVAGKTEAGSLDLGYNTQAQYKLTLNYGVAVRTEPQAGALTHGPIVPLQIGQNYDRPPDCPLTTCLAFLGTGLPDTINFDDGDSNFKQGSLTSNRLSALLETQITHENYGLILSANGFFDQVYHHPNDNSSPSTPNPAHQASTVNKPGQYSEFTEGTRYYDGHRIRMLEAYGYGDWTLPGGMNLNLRVGKQLATWGESLFFSGIASAQAPNDATKAFVPGAEVKDILLPVNQVSLQLSATDRLTVLGQYKLQYKSTELFPVGDYFSIQDEIAPGGQFAYGSVNPLYLDTCPFKVNGQITDPCAALSAIVGPGLGGKLFGAPPYILAPRAADIVPSDFGQWGLGLKYRVTPETTLGLYYLRYHDTNPAVVQNFGFAKFVPSGCLIKIGNNCVIDGTTKLLDQRTPINYQAKFFDGIRMVGSSYSTTIGPFSVAGELNYRDRLDMPIQAEEAGLLVPVYTRGKLLQALTSMIYATGPSALWDDFSFVSEVGYIHVNSVTPIPYVQGSGQITGGSNGTPFSPSGYDVGNGDHVFFSKNSWGFQLLTIPTQHNVFTGWDLATPIGFSAIVKGTPEMAGAFGAMFGEGDQRATVGANFTYLGNLLLGFSYNVFLGDQNQSVRGSQLKTHPYTDRDYAAFNVKYNW